MSRTLYPRSRLTKTALGYLIGPTIGSSIFSLTHPSLSRGDPAPLEVMDREFFSRISKRRGDPSFQSVNNPAPDFYGEKVSVSLSCIASILISLFFLSSRLYYNSLFPSRLSSTLRWTQIVSLSSYRRWLRDQAAYNRKAMHGVPDGE